MDYKALANELFQNMIQTRKMSIHKKVDELSHGERKILGYLTFKKNEAISGELSEHLHLSTPRVAAALNTLSKKGFIKRNRDERDKRMVIVTITESGRSFALEEHEKAMVMIEQTLKKLGEHDAQEFVRIMKRIKEIKNESD
ncbi:MarR family winged helix-turn-helix transcriptional regulator [Bacillus sp. CGMCC 1.16607]|uniref:MarR family winged helix-turn-helix transcriptional regulator n=1 Tax=Bacillus sp. CGMCC 1.16607 TaxID=3351842 RepID=UPI003627C455